MHLVAIAGAVRDARSDGRALRVVGNGGWLHAGRPVNASATITTANDRGIVEYVPGDLTLTARAGTTLAELREATRANDQWLPLDPWGGDAGTVGATIGTASAGPHAHAMGSPRDVVLGLEFVAGTGEVVRPGGRVVKNVAGFDLTRLVVGSWGTLGVITEVTLRLRARPADLRTFAVEVPDTAGTLNDLAVRLRALPFTPLACELLNAALARRLGWPAKATLVVRVGGNANAVRAQVAAVGALGKLTDSPPDVWTTLRGADAGASGVWRWSQLPSAFGDTWTAAADAVRDLDAAIHGSPLRGIVRVIAGGDPAALARAAQGFGGRTVIETLPPAAWAMVPPRMPSRIETAVRAKFDPRGILNPGIMGVSA